MTTIEINGQTYRINKLNALAQFHITRRLSPLLATVGTSLAGLQLGLKAGALDFVAILDPMTEILAKMPEDDANYIIFTCLDKVARQVGERYAPVATNGQLMFEDIEMPFMLQLVFEVIKDSLGNFIGGLAGAVTLPSS